MLDPFFLILFKAKDFQTMKEDHNVSDRGDVNGTTLFLWNLSGYIFFLCQHFILKMDKLFGQDSSL